MNPAAPARRTPRARLGLVALLVGSLALLMSACTNVNSAENGYVSGDGRTIRLAPEDRGEPVDFTGDDLNGESMDLASLRGKPTIVNVWWSGCGPCRVEMPLLEDIRKDLDGTANLIGLNIRDTSAAQGLSFMRGRKVSWPSFYSPDGKALKTFVNAGLLNPRSVPATVVLDSEGRVAAAVNGEITKPGSLINVVREIAAGK